MTTRAPPHLSDLLGSYIGIDNGKVVCERIERPGCVCANVIYLGMSCSSLDDAALCAPDVSGPAVICQHHRGVNSDMPPCSYYMRVTAKESVRLAHAGSPVHFLAYVVLHKDLGALKDADVPCPGDDGLPKTAVLRFTGPLVRWHCTLYHTCLYSVTSACLPTPHVLAQDPCIVVCENMTFRFLGVCPSSSTPPTILDIADIMSQVLIPSPYNTTLGRPSCASGSDARSFL